jgi:integrase
MVTLRPWTADASVPRSKCKRWEADLLGAWPDGTRYRKRVRVPFECGESNARRWAEQREHALIAAGKPAPKAPPEAPKSQETSDAWHVRYLAHCRASGIATISNKLYRWRKWISPRLGSKPMSSVTRDAIEDVRDDLDKAILDGRIAWKTATNIWAEVTVAFHEACSSKARDLRIIASDPTNDVQPPETGARTAKVYPYPSEFVAVASCAKVPLDWRELHAIAAYTYMRPGELYVLEWSDVDLTDQKIRVTKAWDYESKKTKSTKTGESREIAIEANLLPLLERMRKRARGKGLVVPLLSLTNPDECARITRDHFKLAKCVRPRLYVQSRAERHIVFRSWRDAGCTWAIVRGDDVVKVQRRAGHRHINTTMKYVIEAENTGAAFGVPFPQLPAALLDPKKGGEILETVAK